MADGIPVRIAADGAAGLLIASGKVDAVVVGADRIAANGDVANKIGTYGLAVIAKENRVPFYVAAPVSTIDPLTPSGERIPIEERSEEEVLTAMGRRIAPRAARALNPVFDVTPARYVTAIITEKGVLEPPIGDAIRRILP